MRQATAAGAALSAVNPKNLLAGLLAGLLLGWSGSSAQAVVASIAAFSVIASSTVLLPMLAFLVAGQAARRRLSMARDWLVRHHAGAVSVLLMVIGALLVIRGLSGS